MRTKQGAHWARLACPAGALALAIPACALALALGAGRSDGPSAPHLKLVRYTAAATPERLTVSARPINVLSGQTVRVAGRLVPAAPGRWVALQGRSLGRWQKLAVARTGPRGRFVARFRAGPLGAELLRVRLLGVHPALRARGPMLTVYQLSVASWYEDGGATACGFHATMGVANRTLPCGSAVTFLYGGRRVRAVVDDRGPFVPGRTWDLNQNVAAALGFSGVAAVWSSE